MAPTSTPSADALDEWARKLADQLDRSVANRQNETELREDAHALIVDAAAELYGLDDLTSTGERTPGSGRRFYDRAYGGLIVEWEWHMGAARRRHGAEQAIDYLQSLREAHGLDEAFSAVVCDGREWGFLVKDPPQGQLSLEEFTDIPPDQRFQWQPNSRAACRRFLSLLGSNRKRPVSPTALATEFGQGSPIATKAITLLVEAIGARSPGDRVDTLYREWYRSLEVVYESLDDIDGKLGRVLRDAYALQPRRTLGELLFCVHTYFALVARLVAIEVLALSTHELDSQPSLWSAAPDDVLAARMRAIDAGEIPSALHVRNLFEGDLFSWYLDALTGNVELLDTVRDLLDGIGGFAFPRVAFGANPSRDVLRDLYQHLLPRELRKALGEFLTPQWLAEACLERMASVGAAIANGRVLDPTCGTGTFLLPILSARAAGLRSAVSEPTPEQVQALLNGVVGFDLNPVAVVAARTNYVITLGDLATAGNLTLPVWRADSILVPEAPEGQTTIEAGRLYGRSWRELRTSLAKPFPVPTGLATAEAMPELRRLIEIAMEEVDHDASLDGFIAGLERSFSPGAIDPVAEVMEPWDDVREVATELWARMRELRDEGRDGVWARILENSFAPLFVGMFDVVVGNPPWLGWNKMPDTWRAAGEIYWKRYGLWKPPAEGGEKVARPQIGDIATLVYATALDRYCARGGYVGLLVPRSLIIGDPGGRAFRQFKLAAAPDDVGDVGYGPRLPFRVLHCDDWGELNPFAPDASNKPVFLISRSAEAQQFPVPASRWERANRGVRLEADWVRNRLLLREIRGQSSPVVRKVTTSAWSFQAEGMTVIEGGSNRWTFGKGLDTRGGNGIFFVRLLSAHPDAKGRVEIVNAPAAGRDARVTERRGRVEAALVYPVLRGEEVQRWKAIPEAHIIAPYEQKALGKVIERELFLKDYPETDRWLRAFKPILEKRKVIGSLGWKMDGDDWCQIMGVSEHMDGRPAVLVREMARRPAAAVITKRYDKALGRTAAALIDHKLVFTAMTSEDEAHYLAAMINSSPIQTLLASFLNEVAISPATLSRLPIPPFDATDSDTKALVKAAREARAAALKQAPKALSSAEAAVDAAALRILGRPHS